MNLSMWTSYFVEQTPEEAVRLLKENGYDFCELSDEHATVLLARGDAKTVGAQFKKHCDSIGMTVAQGHLPLRIRLCDENAPVLETLCTWLDLFLAIGIKSAVLHCDDMHKTTLSTPEKMERNLAVLKDLTAHLEGTDLVICLENLTRICENADELMWFVETLKSPNLGICLDTGHLNIAANKTDQATFIHRAGKHLKALHIADNEGERDQHLLPFGVGKVDFAAVAGALREIGYDRLFNYEVPGERHAPLEIRAAKLAYAKKIFEHLTK